MMILSCGQVKSKKNTTCPARSARARGKVPEKPGRRRIARRNRLKCSRSADPHFQPGAARRGKLIATPREVCYSIFIVSGGIIITL
jgi:hypothetical protein